MNTYRKKLIEVALPLDAINRASIREGYIYKGNPSAVHKWWAQRPLAACRAVLFGQFVDDPSAWPEQFPSEQEQDRERQRIFRIIEDLVEWENSTNMRVIGSARLEIARSLARGRIADGLDDASDKGVMARHPCPDTVDRYLATVGPHVRDPFAGGGSIPLEAQRLGLRAIATDLNPVAVLINKSLIDLPRRFVGRPPLAPDALGRGVLNIENWAGVSGLAEDVRRYSAWVNREAKERLDVLYPEVEIPEEHGSGKVRPIAWLWARTVESPNPAFTGVHVPLVSNFFLSTKKGREVWLEPVVEGRSYRFRVRTGEPSDPKEVKRGTKLGRGANFRCLLSGSPIEPDYIKREGKAGRLRQTLLAVVAVANKRRVYLEPPEPDSDDCGREPTFLPDAPLPENRQYCTPPLYGMETISDLFTKRQLVALGTLSDLLAEVRHQVLQDARSSGWEGDSRSLVEGGCGAVAYAEAISTYLAFALDKTIEYSNTLVVWYAKEDRPKGLFSRQALPIVWDFVEQYPLGEIGGTFLKSAQIVSDAIPEAMGPDAEVAMCDAAGTYRRASAVFSTDPPYYDNVPYADLSDFFYVWLRRSLADVYPVVTRTVLVPKSDELVANPVRQGGKQAAESFFLQGMARFLLRMSEAANSRFPSTIFYAFKQSETSEQGASSTGWETFLQGVLDAGLQVSGAWPVRTERQGRARGIGSNALASSIVLVCRKRADGSPSVSRGEFRRILRKELPEALKLLQKGNIAPVDMAQASIGPGIGVFSSFPRVLEADGSDMSVRGALQLVSQVTDEVLGEDEGELDQETRFAVTWFESHGFDEGPYGDAETLATARAVSVAGVQDAGVLKSAASKVRLNTRQELPSDWDPRTDDRLTVWEATQHLIKRLDEQGETAAASLLAELGSVAVEARHLAYRLYATCEKSGWAEEAQAYNGLVLAWPQLEKLAGETQATGGSAPQTEMFE